MRAVCAAVGSYDVSVPVKMYKMRGICQPSINGAAVGQSRRLVLTPRAP